MDSIIYLVFRNMRQPLLTLLVVYAVSISGLTLIPGRDADGNVDAWANDLLPQLGLPAPAGTTGSLTEGDVFIDSRDMSRVAPNHRPVNMVFQSYAVFPHMSVARNLTYGARRADPAALGHMAALLDLEHHLKRRPGSLSGGERGRLALAILAGHAQPRGRSYKTVVEFQVPEGGGFKKLGHVSLLVGRTVLGLCVRCLAQKVQERVQVGKSTSLAGLRVFQGGLPDDLVAVCGLP